MKRYTEQEKELAVKIWEESGLTQTEWSKQEGINRRTFGKWVKKYRLERTPSSSQLESSFIEMELPRAPRLEGSYEIVYPNGVILKCPVDISSSDLSNLVSLFHV